MRLAASRRLGIVARPIVLLDSDLQDFAEIWAAAGTPNAVFKLTPDQLRSLTSGEFADIAKR